MTWEVAVALASILAGAIASVAGFGIGSILTPLLSLQLGTQLAIAAVSIPHLAGTALRFLMLRRSLDARVLREFGLASAAGGLAGALLHAQVTDPALRVVFGLLLLLAAASEMFGLARRVRLSRGGALAAGALSGLFGGMVGNQGGIRSAAMLALPLRRDAFVATATATALLVDGARMPVYFASTGTRIVEVWPIVLIAAVGVVAGTLAGRHALARMPERRFRMAIAILLALLGCYMLASR
ncbi:MAG TPA: sulfite exporter TauE/SafE family protein [Gemmatimonadales bacterium]|nr:sulfite exporter TauE/SafE family protein [Gemmatimonadales bacterium]